MPNIAVTNYCNLKCPYCFANEFIEEQKEEISQLQLNKILSFITKSDRPIDRIGIIGGEPTIHSDFEHILVKFINFSKANNTRIIIFTNGINMDIASKYLNKTLSCLINLNEPEVVGESNWNKIMTNLESLKASNKLRYVTLGINLYPDIQNTDYIFTVAKKYFQKEIRCSLVAPTCNYAYSDKDGYYKKAKVLFLNFLNKAKENNIKLNLDCNHIPECYFTDEELELVYKWTNKKANAICHPVVDITPDMKATACFGSYDPVDITDFKTYDALVEYLETEKMCPLKESNSDGPCATCEKFNKECQGGCLSFAKYKKEN